MNSVMARLTFVAFALAAAAIGVTAQERPSMLVTTDWLAAHLQDPNLVLLHVGAKGEFETGHIPGAQPVAYTADIAVPFKEGALSLELLPVDELKANFERLGISDTSRIVVYFGKDWVTPSTRVIFTLNYFGLGDRTSLLDGGMPAWIAAGHAATTDVKAPTPGKLTPHPHPELVVDARLGCRAPASTGGLNY
jgi:thiosulfate/3-mercaptopyruvate sulfurtransferase